MIDRAWVRDSLTGPIASVSLPFQRDGQIDEMGLRNLIDHIIGAGSKTVLLTAGDSLYSILTDREVAEVTRLTAEHTAGRAMVVAADRQWATPNELEFAQYARDVGVDLLMVLPPNWGASCTVETFVEHYAAAAEHIPVMLVTNVFTQDHELGLRTIEALRDRVDGVVAIKDDVCGPFARRMALLVHDPWAVLSGGLKENHLALLPYGCDGYMSTFIDFKPDIAHDYWEAIGAQDLDRARAIITDVEMPLMDFFGPLRGGGDAGVHGSLELFGVAGRWRRKPYHSLTDEEMEQLKGFFQSKGLL
jgi:4-hydroxy-tetrahydrodipicolinate synthase